MKKVHIKDICTKGSSALKQKDLLENGDYPVYGASGIAGYLNEYHQDKEYIAVVKDGSGIGRVSFQEPQSSVIGTMQYILPKEGYNIRYIGYCLQSLDLAGYKQGAAIPHIYFRDYGERLVNVTDDKAEQQAIVSRLDTAFAKIDAVKANAEKQLNDAKALFQKELSKAMTPKEGWEEKKLSDIGKTQTGATPSKNDKSNYGDFIPFIRPTEINYDGLGNINYKSEMSLSEKGLENGRLFKGGSIFMVCIGATIGKVAISTKDVSCNQQINVITPRSNINAKFVFHAMTSNAFKNKVLKEGMSAQATLPIISKGKWEKLTIPIPPLSEQQAIVTHLDTLSEKLKTVEEKQKAIMAECDAMKQALLREVFE